jgi:glycosyltransferase involved in cell wall biosynthesis
MNPTLSIVVPAYNIQPYIEQCVRSVLGQLGEQHELIVVDDGSTDNTRALVLKMQQEWPGSNFHLISQPNEGLAGVRNNGLRAAKGDYIVWVDGDDVLRDGVLAMLDQAIAAEHPDVIAFGFRMWHPDAPRKTHDVKLSYPENVLMRDPDLFLTTFLATRKCYVWTNVIRRELYAQMPDPVFPPGRVFEDMSTVPRLLSHCATMLYLPHSIIDYRQIPTSITKTVSEKWCLDIGAGLAISRQRLQARGVSEVVQRHFDVMAGHFFIGVYKCTYQLPGDAGKRVRASLKATFKDAVFGDCASILSTVKNPKTISVDRPADLVMARQLRKGLTGNLIFHYIQSANRKRKVWRQARNLRKHNAALALAQQR